MCSGSSRHSRAARIVVGVFKDDVDVIATASNGRRGQICTWRRRRRVEHNITLEFYNTTTEI
jgi:hypothetical protein